MNLMEVEAGGFSAMAEIAEWEDTLCYKHHCGLWHSDVNPEKEEEPVSAAVVEGLEEAQFHEIHPAFRNEQWNTLFPI